MIRPFHAGEMALQERMGSRAHLEEYGTRIMRDHMPDQHRELFAQLPFLIAGSLDAEDRPWASILTGLPGFIQSPDPRTLTVTARPVHGDPLAEHLAAGAPIGLLGIQLETRRRNRMNGTVTGVGDATFTVAVGQSFGNCPKYIQARTPGLVRHPMAAGAGAVHAEGTLLSPAAVAMLRATDTFFIASASPQARGGTGADGVDVSHRGGKPGFVRVTNTGGASVLTVPDFLGNFFFNTLGNIAVNPKSGILVIDFERGDLLSLTGDADVIWDGPELAGFPGAQRLLRFRVRAGVRIEDGTPLRWSEPAYSPHLAGTGTWQDGAPDARPG
jgi:predicted pyridoxine 5'-phosphate oxidase superfamily flavin-nucleotide-binding protein